MRALVVDDSRATRMIIGQIVREIGFDVIQAGNGMEALAELAQYSPVDLMLVDWNMPVMNGIELIRAVRSQEKYRAARILMVSSEAQGAQVAQALEAGADDYLMKPFNKELLVAKLELLHARPE